ncbi:hypothetical protein [Gillisia limnaea]|uniref:Uncharacterized protein n=1 Tax=Gillisia limnaea (strain DSM 15749 / LMG 21470 / R-8282) TaxID=865937 RepID=H2BUM0_GILLR|nr:hypothetical protein [Gillisia limnaea]EHQ01675.1 hypothetical protein Gilli_0990 [Gillisia limnaea DSM 15749]
MKPKENARANKKNQDPIPNKKKRNRKTDPLNIGFKTPLKEHKNPIIRGFAKTGYTVWIVVMVVGLTLAFVVALFLV